MEVSVCFVCLFVCLSSVFVLHSIVSDGYYNKSTVFVKLWLLQCAQNEDQQQFWHCPRKSTDPSNPLLMIIETCFFINLGLMWFRKRRICCACNKILHWNKVFLGVISLIIMSWGERPFSVIHLPDHVQNQLLVFSNI